ncbi:MAG: pyridoxal-phosphate dependent enzyme [Candidatus Methanomethylicaceae archaeon]
MLLFIIMVKIEKFIEDIYNNGLKPFPPKEIEISNKVTILVKMEYPKDFNMDPLRTIKRKPATLLLMDLMEKGYIRPGKTLISASSGNFLRELTLKALDLNLDLKIIGVTPPIIPKENLEILKTLGVNIIHISKEYDLCPRETTVFFTRALAEKYRLQYVNIDQYYSWQNVLSHLFMTWKEIKELGDIDYLCIPLGSTGTFMGVCLGSKLEKNKMKIIGIQPTKTHHIPGVHYIVGECEWNPEIYSPVISYNIVTVDDIDAYSGLIKLWEYEIYSGPSTGMVFYYALKLAEKINEGRILIISADSIFAYQNYILEYLRNIKANIVKRYPTLKNSLNEYIEWLKRQPSIEERLNLIKRIYKPKSDEGKIYEVSDIVSTKLPF